MAASMRLSWLQSDNGPFLLLPKELLSSWNGLPNDPNVDPMSYDHDYGRLQDFVDYVANVVVGGGQGVVFGEQREIAVMPEPNNDMPCLVQWLYGEDEIEVLAHLRSESTNISEKARALLVVQSGQVVLFGAAYSGAEVVELRDKIELSLRPGTYNIVASEFRPNNQTFLILHKFYSVGRVGVGRQNDVPPKSE